MKVLFTVCFIFLYFKGSQGQKGSIKDATLSLASSYGDHMVLQKAPAFPGIWGYSSNVGDVITVQLLNTKIMQQIQTTVRMGPEGKGVWKVLLSPVGAGGPYSIKIYNSHGDSITINDVLFGDVWVCSGQSNMQFTVAGAFNATAEIADAASFPNIRVFTVAMETATVPQYDFISVEEPWSVASPASVGHGNWTYFSAVCWLYGKYLYQKLNYPIGLVASDWGGTPIETWSSTDALEKCGLTEDSNTDPDPDEQVNAVPTGHSQLWNAMIHPFLNYTIYGAIWYQGEANAGNPSLYNCTFPAMIDDWRVKFSENKAQTSSNFPFGFVQLAADRDDASISTGFPGIRWSQTASYGMVPNPTMENVFMAVAMDLPDYKSPFGSVHPRDKQTVATRLTLSGLAVAYSIPEKFQGPFPSNVAFDEQNTKLIITYDMGQTVITTRSQNGFEFCCSASSDVAVCETASLTSWFPVTSLTSSSTSVTLNVPTSCSNQQMHMLRYAWRESPCPYKQCAVYSVVNELPGPPFKMMLSK